MSYCQLLIIANKGEANTIMAACRAAGAPGGTFMVGQGTASNAILAALGLGDSSKEILLSVIKDEEIPRIMDAIHQIKGKLKKAVVAVIDCNTVYVRGAITQSKRGEDDMDEKWEMIQVVCEDGYSEEVMAAARKAGAKGGTIIHAHGTCTEQDVKFFGAPIVPEKELLMIIVPSQKSDLIISAITGLECLHRPGLGVVFSLPVRAFENLG